MAWRKLRLPKVALRPLTVCLALLAAIVLVTGDGAIAASKSHRCDVYARNAAHATPTRGGPLRGAAAGAAIGSFAASAGAGAAIGAAVGVTRRVAQRSRSYHYYYDRCMSR